MKKILKNIEGDRAIWAIVVFMALLSFMPVYSASTNLVYVANSGTTTYHLVKHVILLFFGFLIIYGVHKVPYRYFSGGSVLMLPLVVVLLIVTLSKGTVIGGANASRWIQIPFIGVGFQTSTLAGVVLMIFVARYLAKNKEKTIYFKESLWKLWLPVAITLAFILPANFSTTAIIFSMVLLLTFLGGYPFKYLASIIGMGIVALVLFVLIAKAFPNAMHNRVDTWISRIENFSDKNAEEGYQVEKAKIAIASGGLQGRGPGKSVQKNFLPQSSSDFIFAIIVEEYGLIFGALTVILMYLLLLIRILVAAKKATTIFATLLIIGVGLPIIFQAIINMAVAVNLFPVTGQTLPLISSGGTSIWMTCFAIGIILSVTAEKEKIIDIENEDNPLDILHEAID
ncbi:MULTISPECIES: FtsW/RodA/SpoVE family cell cycle protein [Flavobacteriaceae]|uniref:Probable peptidoglycan glycosyltransferase FtsW n=2 Tax=Flavobacteriaceae TaxID=49546 RepID=A0A4Y8AT02_9FLAO|nr:MULTISPECIES: FtsW/RodA/SpoVE family cell cycle protein [Flavobacteriaceae]TEW75015.1 cell division protein FtsW [Gramella jeungdoensis]GGK42275.1 cell division protein FtsW [Lutibacter litoralis]